MINLFYGVILFFIFLLLLKNIKDYYSSKISSQCDIDNHKRCEFNKLKDHLLEHSKLSKCKKPILWIYIDFEKNARKWIDFGTKNSTNLNMPYIYLCLKTIIDNCGDSFHIVIIDENSFDNLIPGWSIDLKKISDPLKEKYINLAKLQLLKNFGGIFVPPSFICKKDLYELYYENCVYNDKMFSCEFINNCSNINKNLIPKLDFFGCKKNNSNIDGIIQDYEYILAKDYTEESLFDESMSQILLNNDKILNIIDGKNIGIKDRKDKCILIEDLMSNKKLELYDNHLGIYIPYKSLKIRNKYNWFLYLSPIEILNSQTFIGRYLSQSI
ncbi:hypothetical protein CL656_05295 [bacterium]|nr:hypothetical protein [bacterium]|tara:strand:- start:864 stop:1844 length:981 start_codon:yes stop_codon:yes gene_type:complete